MLLLCNILACYHFIISYKCFCFPFKAVYTMASLALFSRSGTSVSLFILINVVICFASLMVIAALFPFYFTQEGALGLFAHLTLYPSVVKMGLLPSILGVELCKGNTLTMRRFCAIVQMGSSLIHMLILPLFTFIRTWIYMYRGYSHFFLLYICMHINLGRYFKTLVSSLSL